MEGSTQQSQTPDNKGKMVMPATQPINVADIRPTDSNKMIEVKVYRKWIGRNPKKTDPTGVCCILLDRQGSAIQANMAPKDILYFERKIQENLAYKIAGFSCEPARTWQRAVSHKTSLIFGHATTFDIIPADDFPQYYFEFAAHNELPKRADVSTAILTDYIGTIQRIDTVRNAGSTTSSLTRWRVIDVQNLDGKTVKFKMWNEMAMEFDEEEYNRRQKPVIIAIASCRVTNRFNEIQLTGTSATRYFLNPNIPEADEIRNVYDTMLDLPPALTIESQRFENEDQERNRNRVSLKTLLDINPESYRYVRFTNEATILSIDRTRPWYYKKCSQCPLKTIEEFPVPRCVDHGFQPTPTYGYCFRAMIHDGTTTVTLICFSPESERIIPECNKLLPTLEDQNPYHYPQPLLSLEGTQHIFQLHFTKESVQGNVQFILDKILDPTPLPALPIATSVQQQMLLIGPSETSENVNKASVAIPTAQELAKNLTQDEENIEEQNIDVSTPATQDPTTAVEKVTMSSHDN